MAKADTSRDVVIRFSGDLKNLQSIPQQFRSITNQVATQANSLNAAFKASFGFIAGTSLTRFIKGTLREAMEDGSALQKSLGSGVAAAKELNDAFASVKIGIQQATLTILSELTPALKAAAGWVTGLAQNLSGGSTGLAARVDEERKANAARFGKDFQLREQIQAAEVQRSLLMKQMAESKIPDARRTGLADSVLRFLPGLGTGPLEENQFDLMQSNLHDINLELGSLKTHFAAIEAENMRVTFRGMKNAAEKFTSIFTSMGRGLFQDASRLGGNVLDQGRAGVLGIRQHLWDAQAESARRAIEVGASPADRMREEWRELQRLRNTGGVNAEQFENARRGMLIQGLSGLPGPQQTPGLAATQGRYITRGPEQKQTEEISAMRRELKALLQQQVDGQRMILAEIQAGGDAGGL